MVLVQAWAQSLAPASPLYDLSQLISLPLFFRTQRRYQHLSSSDTVKIKWDVICKRFTIVLSTINVNSSCVNIFYNKIYFNKNWPELICFCMQEFYLFHFIIMYIRITFSLPWLGMSLIHSIDILALYMSK